ncbi:MAG: hypothetical protein WBD20_00340 [Pirellulaceae bacterium]
MRSRQKPSFIKHSLFKSSLLAAVSFAILPSGSMLQAVDPLPPAKADHEIASLPRLPAAIDSLPINSGKSKSPQPIDLSDSVILNTRSFGIPFNVDNAGSRPVEVQLFVSHGAKSEWKLLESKPPSVKEFQFKGTNDGVYWFATRTIDSAGNASPQHNLSPQLRVFVDTSKPNVKLDADADASGRVDAAVLYEDQTPIKSVQMHYASDVLREWTKLNVRDLATKGKIDFTPKENWQQLSLQVIVTDSANNHTVATKLIQRPRIATRENPGFAVIDSYETTANDESIRLVADDSPTTKPNIYVHRAGQNSDAVGVTRREPKSESQLDTETDTTEPAAKIAQVPNTVVPQQRFSPQPVANSFFVPGHDNASQAMDPRHNDPRNNDPRALSAPQSSAPPAMQTNQFGSGLTPETPSFGPPSVTDNQKLYHLVRPTTSVPTDAGIKFGAAAPPSTFAMDPNAPPVPPGMQPMGPRSMQPMDARSMQPMGAGAFASPAQPLPGAITLPPAATPDQISNGFGGLNLPNEKQSLTSTADAGSATELSIDRAPNPPRASRTVAEAMRPLASKSATENRTPSVESNPTQRRPVDVESPEYKAMRQSQAAYDNARLADRAVVRYSDSERFSLEYELEAVGAGGAESVDLYGSTDAGQNWKQWGSDPDLVSPFDIETKGEGTFAFKIVVISRNGLASPRPLANETPDIVVIVDKSEPDVRITDVKYGEGERTGSLVIRYDCTDHNLMQRPIALSFSDTPDGPWTTIAAGLRNEGDYVWPGDPELPRQIYLRLDAKDRAGNAGSYVLQEPIDVQGLAPRARIRGFRSLSGTDFSEPNGQTANRPKAAFK